MALVGKIEKKQVDTGQPAEEVFVAEFTNGTLAQLRELAAFLKTQGISIPVENDKQLEEVVKLGIAYLQRSKELATGNHE